MSKTISFSALTILIPLKRSLRRSLNYDLSTKSAIQAFFIKSSYVPSQSDDSEQPERPTIELEVVRCDEPHVGGRPLFLNARRFIRICRAIERGESACEACRQQLTTYRNFRMHVARNPKYQRRLRQAEEVREHFQREFHIANITRHAAKTVAASMFWLERRYPAEFA